MSSTSDLTLTDLSPPQHAGGQSPSLIPSQSQADENAWQAEEQGIDGNHEREQLNLPRADGGKDAWLFLCGCFMIEALVWGECEPFSLPFTKPAWGHAKNIVIDISLVLALAIPIYWCRSRTLIVPVGAIMLICKRGQHLCRALWANISQENSPWDIIVAELFRPPTKSSLSANWAILTLFDLHRFSVLLRSVSRILLQSSPILHPDLRNRHHWDVCIWGHVPRCTICLLWPPRDGPTSVDMPVSQVWLLSPSPSSHRHFLLLSGISS